MWPQTGGRLRCVVAGGPCQKAGTFVAEHVAVSELIYESMLLQEVTRQRNPDKTSPFRQEARSPVSLPNMRYGARSRGAAAWLLW